MFIGTITFPYFVPNGEFFGIPGYTKPTILGVTQILVVNKHQFFMVAANGWRQFDSALETNQNTADHHIFIYIYVYEVSSKCWFPSCVIIRVYIGARFLMLSFWAHLSI